ncbi:MAG: hypothetical protein ABR881_19255 [Candidatus Sulfotelmatobacter sp.]|jgi:hypothetical protein
MNVPLALLVEHDWIDKVNAVSTLAIAAFTVLMFFVVLNQLRTSKDIERSWVMPKLTRDSQSSMLLCEGTSSEHGKITSVTTTAFVSLTLKNDGRSPVWVKDLHARLVLLDSVDKLPKKPELNDDDDQQWYPAPFADGGQESLRLQLTANGSQVAKQWCVVYGKITYLDIFRKERFSTFGYVIESGGSTVDRLQSHPEYNRNT